MEERMPGLMFVDYVDLAGGPDGVALIDLDPSSPAFGEIVQRADVAVGARPHHRCSDAAEERLYTTALGGAYLYELGLRRDAAGTPRVAEVIPLDTRGNEVGEDVYFTRDGRFLVTFMGGHGGVHGGSVGVF